MYVSSTCKKRSFSFTPINIANLNFSNFVPEKRDKKNPNLSKEQNTILALITLSSFPHIDVDE